MAFKFLALFALCAVASGVYVPQYEQYQHAPVLSHSAPSQKVYAHAEDYDDHPKYNFEYGVEDKHTGDIKSQTEQRDGDVVHGEYSLVDADGYKRTVHYTADDHNGFQAEVHREPLQHVVKSVAAPAHYAAPTIVKSAAPSHQYIAPALVKSYAAPQQHYSPIPSAQYSGYESHAPAYHH